jgi:hypothetical protein
MRECGFADQTREYADINSKAIVCKGKRHEEGEKMTAGV